MGLNPEKSRLRQEYVDGSLHIWDDNPGMTSSELRERRPRHWSIVQPIISSRPHQTMWAASRRVRLPERFPLGVKVALRGSRVGL